MPYFLFFLRPKELKSLTPCNNKAHLTFKNSFQLLSRLLSAADVTLTSSNLWHASVCMFKGNNIKQGNSFSFSSFSLYLFFLSLSPPQTLKNYFNSASSFFFLVKYLEILPVSIKNDNSLNYY